jgi:uncharacterized protein YaaQ
LSAKTVNRLMIAVVQFQDVDGAIKALNKASFKVTRISSTGGFLGRRNITMLIGFTNGEEQTVVEIFKRTCRRRVEYVATPLEGSPFHLPLSTPVTVGGATIFTFVVERYEEISK